jgi:hypothetical protein
MVHEERIARFPLATAESIEVYDAAVGDGHHRIAAVGIDVDAHVVASAAVAAREELPCLVAADTRSVRGSIVDFPTPGMRADDWPIAARGRLGREGNRIAAGYRHRCLPDLVRIVFFVEALQAQLAGLLVRFERVTLPLQLVRLGHARVVGLLIRFERFGFVR